MGRFVRKQVEVPGSAVLALAGGAAWLAGSAALPSGAGTVVLAAGLAVTVWLMVQATRAGGTGRGPRLDRDRRRRVLSLLVVGVGLVVLGGTLICLVPSKIKMQYARTQVVGYTKKHAPVEK